MDAKKIVKGAGRALGLIVLAGCSTGRSGHYIGDRFEHAIFPRSTEILQLPEFKPLGNYELRIEDPQLLISGTAYEAWSDQRFVENSSMTLRYRYQYSPAVPEINRSYEPVILGLDVALPLSPVRLRAAEGLIAVLQAKWRISLEPVRASLMRKGGDGLSFESFQFDNAVAEIAVKDLGPRGRSLSLDFYEVKFYHQNFQR